MAVSLTSAREEVVLLSWSEPHDPARRLAAGDPHLVRGWLADLAGRAGNAALLRAFYRQHADRVALDHVSDAAVLDGLADLLAAGRVVAEVRPHRAYAGGPRQVTTSPSPPAELRAASDPRTHWIRIKVVDDATGQAIPGVVLHLRLPDGVEGDYPTRADGAVEAHDLPAGKCEASCALDGARRDDTLSFVRLGAAATGGAEAPDDDPDGADDAPPRGVRIANVVEHKVQTGETIDSLARANGLTWQALSEFNWNTSVPDEINEHLRDEVGCTQKTVDGYNYIFTSADDPGLILIPRRWTEYGLVTDREHVLRVRSGPAPQRPDEWEFSI